MTARPNLLSSEDLPPVPVQRRSLEKRARIKAAGLAVFGERGYTNASISEIALRANLAVGGVYLHFRSKRQLLLVLMDELLEGLSGLNLAASFAEDVRFGIRDILTAAFSHDLSYLGAYKAWREAALSDPDLERKQQEIQRWTVRRTALLFGQLQKMPGARAKVDIQALAVVMDSFFWGVLAEAATLTKPQLRKRIEASAHLIYHGLFADASPKAAYQA